jgi:hypothetical protein
MPGVSRREEPVLDRETVNGIIAKLMASQADTSLLVRELIGEDGEEEADA